MQFWFCHCDYLYAFGVGKGVDGHCAPLATLLQRYCDPASLVLSIFSVMLVNNSFILFSHYQQIRLLVFVKSFHRLIHHT